jgi:hypothetical protein
MPSEGISRVKPGEQRWRREVVEGVLVRGAAVAARGMNAREREWRVICEQTDSRERRMRRVV